MCEADSFCQMKFTQKEEKGGNMCSRERERAQSSPAWKKQKKRYMFKGERGLERAAKKYPVLELLGERTKRESSFVQNQIA